MGKNRVKLSYGGKKEKGEEVDMQVLNDCSVRNFKCFEKLTVEYKKGIAS